MNVSIVDSEKAAKNVENKKMSRQNPYEEEEEIDKLFVTVKIIVFGHKFPKCNRFGHVVEFNQPYGSN